QCGPAWARPCSASHRLTASYALSSSSYRPMCTVTAAGPPGNLEGSTAPSPATSCGTGKPASTATVSLKNVNRANGGPDGVTFVRTKYSTTSRYASASQIAIS